MFVDEKDLYVAANKNATHHREKVLAHEGLTSLFVLIDVDDVHSFLLAPCFHVANLRLTGLFLVVGRDTGVENGVVAFEIGDYGLRF